jgi:hypothetical protein
MLICDLEIEHLEHVDGEDVVGGDSAPAQPAQFPSQFLGGTSGVFSVALFGFNGTPFAESNSFSRLTGSFPAFNVEFGTIVRVQTTP